MNSKDIDTLEVVFDNGGGITIQTATFVHKYDDPKQAAQDAKAILSGADTRDWDGNEPGDRITYTDDDIRNGGYLVLDADGVRALPTSRDREWGHNAEDFAREL